MAQQIKQSEVSMTTYGDVGVQRLKVRSNVQKEVILGLRGKYITLADSVDVSSFFTSAHVGVAVATARSLTSTLRWTETHVTSAAWKAPRTISRSTTDFVP